MANKRMFSKSIIRTDAFLDMSLTSQCLYFHLGIEADDDGFVTPKMIMRTLGSTQDDLKNLVEKGFVVPFESGVVVIRHWREHNYIQADRYKPTVYKRELEILRDDPVYKLDTRCIQAGNPGEKRLGQVRLEEKRGLGDSSLSDKSGKQGASFKGKPTYRGLAMRKDQWGRWWVVPADGGKWAEFGGKESEIEWK